MTPRPSQQLSLDLRETSEALEKIKKYSDEKLPAPSIQVIFNSSKNIWLSPNELVSTQLRRELFKALPLGGATAQRVETFNSVESKLAAELYPPLADEFTRGLILFDLAYPLAEILQDSLSIKLNKLRAEDYKKLAHELGDAFDRLKLAALTWDEVAKLPPSNLCPTLAELGRRHDALLEELNLIDHFGRRRQVLNELNSGRHFRTLEGVEEITCHWSQRLSPFETDFIKALASFHRVKLRLTVPAWIRDENIDHGAGFDLLRSIKNIEESKSPSLNLEFREIQEKNIPPALAYAAENILAPLSYRLPKAPELEGSLRLCAAPSAYHEVEETARRIKKLLKNGKNPNSMAIVVPDLKQYAPLFDDVSRRFGLAFHLRRGRPLADYGPVEAAMSLIDLWKSNWERSRLFELLRSPYFIFTETELDPSLINRLTIEAGMHDKRAGCGFDLLKKLRGDKSKTAEKLLEILSSLEKSGQKAVEAFSWKDFIKTFTSILNDLRWPGKTEDAPQEPLNLKAADLAAAHAFKEELHYFEDKLETSPVCPKPSLGTFELFFKELLEEKHLNWDKDPDGRIYLLNYFDLHGSFFDEIFFLGLNERVFPRNSGDGKLWPEEFRKISEIIKRPLWNDEADNYRQDELLFSDALGQAQKRIWLFYHKSDASGRECLPSSLISSLEELWPEENGLKLEETGGPLVPLAEAASFDEVLRASITLKPAEWPEKYAEKIDTSLKELKFRAQRWQKMKKRADISPESIQIWLNKVEKINGLPLVPASLPAAFAQCPFFFWSSYVLGLTPDGETDEQWPKNLEGTLLHNVLEKFFQKRIMAQSLWPGEEQYEACLDELLDILEQECQKHAEENPLGRLPLWEIRRRGLKNFLAKWLKRELLSESTKPLFTEWSFGAKKKDAAPPFRMDFPQIETGLYFKGRVDRIDLDGHILKICDYKLSRRPDLQIREKEGEATLVPPALWPILTYTLAASKYFGKKSQAVFKFLDPSLNLEKASTEFFSSDDEEMLREKKLDYNFQSEVAKAWEGILRGLYPLSSEEGAFCRWCCFDLFCPQSGDGESEET